MELKEHLTALSDASGVTGLDNAIAVAEAELSKLGEIERDRMGGIAAKIKGDNDYTILLDAHIDEIGLIVTGIDGDFIRVAKCGGIDQRVLISQEVIIHGKEDIFGVFCSVPPHIKTEKNTVPELSDMAIDVGMNHDDIIKLVSVGDRISFRQKTAELINNRLTGKSLDNRAGCAAVIAAVKMLCKDSKPKCNIIVSLSAQEELGLRGARTSAFKYSPDEAIVVDVSFGAYPGVPKQQSGKLEKGPMIGISPVTDRFMTAKMKDLADENGIPYQCEVCGGTTGTNADIISVTKSGIPTALLSIPLINMHTPTEVISVTDVENTAKLIAEYIGKAVD